MRRLFYSLLMLSGLALTSCEVTQELTINEDGTGSFSNRTNMGAVLSLLQSMGQGGEMDKMEDVDKTLTGKEAADSIEGLTAEEKAMIADASLRLKLNKKGEEFVIQTNFPFKSVNDIKAINALEKKMMKGLMADQMGDMKIPEDQGADDASIDQLYKIEYSNGELTRKVDDEKFAKAKESEGFQQLEQASGMGITMKFTYVFKLPRAAQKAEGKNLTLSADKKTVTVSADLDDIMKDPASLAFKIKY